jgi:hypothetical protein
VDVEALKRNDAVGSRCAMTVCALLVLDRSFLHITEDRVRAVEVHDRQFSLYRK